MKRIIAATLVLSLMAPALPALAAGPAATPLRDSAKQAVSTDAAYGPRSMPRQGDKGVRNQMGGGGGKTGMIVGLVSAAAGIGLTVYMLKYMKKSTDAAKASN